MAESKKTEQKRVREKEKPVPPMKNQGRMPGTRLRKVKSY